LDLVILTSGSKKYELVYTKMRGRKANLQKRRQKAKKKGNASKNGKVVFFGKMSFQQPRCV